MRLRQLAHLVVQMGQFAAYEDMKGRGLVSGCLRDPQARQHRDRAAEFRIMFDFGKRLSENLFE